MASRTSAGERVVAFVGCLYYAALRPEEVVYLRLGNLVSLPDQGWGELLLTNSEPRSGTWWTDGGSARPADRHVLPPPRPGRLQKETLPAVSYAESQDRG